MLETLPSFNNSDKASILSDQNVQPDIPTIDLKLETVTVTGGTIFITQEKSVSVPDKKKAKRQYKKALELFVEGHHKKAFKLLNKAILNDPKTKKYFLKGDLENIFI